VLIGGGTGDRGTPIAHALPLLSRFSNRTSASHAFAAVNMKSITFAIAAEPDALDDYADQYTFADHQKVRIRAACGSVSFKISATICLATPLCNSPAASAFRTSENHGDVMVILYPSSSRRHGRKPAPCPSVRSGIVNMP
jgi:hypothetical protein